MSRQHHQILTGTGAALIVFFGTLFLSLRFPVSGSMDWTVRFLMLAGIPLGVAVTTWFRMRKFAISFLGTWYMVLIIIFLLGIYTLKHETGFR